MVQKKLDAEEKFPSTYASFIAAVAVEKGELYVAVVRSTDITAAPSDKPAFGNVGVIGGVERDVDQADPIKTATREAKEEAGMIFLNGEEKNLRLLHSQRKPNDDQERRGWFYNHFHLLVMPSKVTLDFEASLKETVDNAWWVKIEEVPDLRTKYNHVLAIIEACYYLEEMVGVTTDQKWPLSEDKKTDFQFALARCSWYMKYARPTSVGWKKYDKSFYKEQSEIEDVA